jgi:hypothetical protein
MGFFAILREEKSPEDFIIQECHINLWSLGGITGVGVFYGILASASKQGRVHSLQLEWRSLLEL